jgi:hypothetical protein
MVLLFIRIHYKNGICFVSGKVTVCLSRTTEWPVLHQELLCGSGGNQVLPQWNWCVTNRRRALLSQLFISCGCNAYRRSCMTAMRQKLLHGCEHWVRQFQQRARFSTPRTAVVFSPNGGGNTLFSPGRSVECARMFVSTQAPGRSGATVNFFFSQEGWGILPRVEFCWINLYAAVLFSSWEAPSLAERRYEGSTVAPAPLTSREARADISIRESDSPHVELPGLTAGQRTGGSLLAGAGRGTFHTDGGTGGGL